MPHYTIRRPDGSLNLVRALTLGDYRKPFTVAGEIQLKNGRWVPSVIKGRLESVKDFENPRKPYSLLGLVNNRHLIKVRVLKAVAS